MNWETVYVFISSTFNDMHAERDYLVKRVFPELRTWCAKRRLRLVEIDLRWGVSEKDAQENKRVVEVCMRNIDQCRPFFLGFLGQRRGWVPQAGDINEHTYREFPELKEYVGKASVTEMEILHALLHPLDGRSTPVRHARFYERDARYLKQIQNKEIKKLFAPKSGLFSHSDKQLENFKKELRQHYPVITYEGSWNENQKSSELVNLNGKDLSQGRLENFRVGEESLKDNIIRWLKEEIAEEFPDHAEQQETADPIRRELAMQDTQRFQAMEGYIARPEAEKVLADYLTAEEERPLMVFAEAGFGKTALLAQLLKEQKTYPRVYYRFVGTTAASASLGKLSASLVGQWIQDGLLNQQEGEHTEDELRLMFSNLLKKAGEKAPFLLVLDGMDQLPKDQSWQGWLPEKNPAGCKIIFSMRGSEEPPAGLAVYRLGRMEDPKDKEQMIRGYLGTFLKDVDDEQLTALMDMPGSGNPLYLKIVLNELRQHGSFETLMELLRRNYGKTPEEAFGQVLKRIHEEMKARYRIGNLVLFCVFGALACAQESLDTGLLLWVFHNVEECKANTDQENEDIIHDVTQEMAPFLVLDGDKIGLRYDSLRRAVLNMYDQDLQQILHDLLALSYGKRAEAKGEGHDFQQLLYHTARARREDIDRMFSTPVVLLGSLSTIGAREVAETCYTIEERGCEGFRELGDVLLMAGARLEANPQTLYMELRRYANGDSAIVQKILSGEKNAGQLSYFMPMQQPGFSKLLKKEFAFGEEVRDLVSSEKYWITQTRTMVTVTEKDSLKPVNIMYLKMSKEEKAEIAAGEQTLYITYWVSSRFSRWERYSLPELELLESGVSSPEVSAIKGACWHMQESGGQLYGYMEVRPQNAKTRAVLLRLTTGEVVWQREVEDALEHALTPGYMATYDKAKGRIIIFSLAKERVVWEGCFEGRANMRCAQAEDLYIWMAAAGESVLYQLRDGEGDMETVRRIVPRSAGCTRFSALAGGYLAAESSGWMTVLSPELEVLGYMDMGENVDWGKAWCGQADLQGETLYIGMERRIGYLLWPEFLKGLSQEYVKSAHIQYDCLMKEDSLYVLGPEMERYRLPALEKEEEQTEGPNGYYSYCPWNHAEDSVYADFAAGANPYAGAYCVKQLSSMKLMARSGIKDRLEKSVCHAFLYWDSGCSFLRLCLVVADRKKVEHVYRGKRQRYLHLELRTCDLRYLDEERAWKVMNLGVDVADTTPLSVYPQSVCWDGHAALVLPNIYKDEYTHSLWVYRVDQKKLVFQKDYHEGLLYEDFIAYRPGCAAFQYREEGQLYLYELNMREQQNYCSRAEGALVPSRGEELMMYVPRKRAIQIYSLDAHQVIQEVTLDTSKETTILVEEAAGIGDWLVVKKQGKGALEVYSRSKNKKLFEQRMEHMPEKLFVNEKEKILASYSPDRRAGFWKMV